MRYRLVKDALFVESPFSFTNSSPKAPRAASDRVEIGGLPVGDDPRRKNPAVSAPHLYPEFEANLRLRHGPGALEVCVRAPFGVDDLSPKSGPPDSPGSMYETSAMRGPGRWAREP